MKLRGSCLNEKGQITCPFFLLYFLLFFYIFIQRKKFPISDVWVTAQTGLKKENYLTWQAMIDEECDFTSAF
jgi:hypothetical protein